MVRTAAIFALLMHQSHLDISSINSLPNLLVWSSGTICTLAIKEHGLEGNNGFLGTFIPDGLRETTRKPIPVDVIRDIQKTCKEMDDDLRWLIALLSDTGMRLGEAVGLLKSNIILNTDTPHLNLIPHPWCRLKTSGSERKIPLVGASLWSAIKIKQSNSTN